MERAIIVVHIITAVGLNQFLAYFNQAHHRFIQLLKILYSMYIVCYVYLYYTYVYVVDKKNIHQHIKGNQKFCLFGVRVNIYEQNAEHLKSKKCNLL